MSLPLARPPARRVRPQQRVKPELDDVERTGGRVDVCTFDHCSAARLRRSVIAGRADVYWSGYYITTSRLEQNLFTVPYLSDV